jgi:iron(III) transport system substrate-binding protein
MLRKEYLKIIFVVLMGMILLTISVYAGQEVKKEVTEEGVFLDGEFIVDRRTYLKAVTEGEVQFYTAHSLAQDEEMVRVFMDLFPEIKVEITRAGGATLHEKMLTEEAAGILKADVVINSDRNYLQEFYDNGWLSEHIPPSCELYPESSKELGYYYPTGASPIIIAYHSAIVSEEEAPKDWIDLGDPKWKGNLGGQRLGGGAMWSMVCFLRSQLGVEVIESWGPNEPIMYTSGGGLANALVAGEIYLTPMGLYAGYPMKYAQEAPIELVYPESGCPLYIPVIGIMEQGENPNAAKLFMNWYLSVEGQYLLATLRGQYSLRDDVPSIPHVPPLSEINYWIPEPEFYLDAELRDTWIQEANKVWGWQ